MNFRSFLEAAVVPVVVACAGLAVAPIAGTKSLNLAE